MSNFLKSPLRTLFTAIGGSLPTAIHLHRGMFAWKRAASTEDEIYAGLLDASSVMQWRRLATTTYADSTYVNVSGDTMTGILTLSKDGNLFIVRKITPSNTDLFYISDTAVNLLNGQDFLAYSDNESARVFHLDGATGNIDLEGQITLGTGAAEIIQGTGSPESAASAPIGSLFLRTDGGTATAVYIKESGTGNTGWVALAAGVTGAEYHPIPSTFPLGRPHSSAGGATALVSNTTYALYMGRADAAYTTVNLRVEVTTGASTITWAEVGVGTSPAITLNGAAAITTRGYTNVAATFNSTGEKTTSVTTSGIAAGDHLWALFGSQASTPYQTIAALSDMITSGVVQSKATTRPSTMASPSTFAAVVDGPGGWWIGS